MNPDVMLTIAFVGEAVLVAIAGLAIARAQRQPDRDEMGEHTPLAVFEKGARGGDV